MTASRSPLCPHVENWTPQAGAWLRSLTVRPKAVKVFDPGVARAVKAIDPSVITVLRRYVSRQSEYLFAGRTGAITFVAEAGDLSGVDYMEGLNEMFTDATVALVNEFDQGLVAACRMAGVKPVGTSIAVGNPASVGDIALYAPAAQAILSAGGYLNYHGYGGFPILAGEAWYVNRAPLTLEPELRRAGVVGQIRWMYTEAGYDYIRDPTIPSRPGWGWLVKDRICTAAQVREGYAALARRLGELGVEYAFVYTFWGGPMWAHFEHADDADMLAWFARHWEESTMAGELQAKVVNTGGLGLRVRAGAGMNMPILGVLPEDGRWFGPVERLDNGWTKIPITQFVAAGVTVRPSATGQTYCYAMSRYLEFREV